MNAPDWLNAVLQEFGQSTGVSNFRLNSQDVAVLRFENGSSLRFEYGLSSLIIAMEIPTENTVLAMKRLLAYAQPDHRSGFTLRAGYLSNRHSAILSARLSEWDVTLPSLAAVTTELLNLAEEFRNRLE